MPKENANLIVRRIGGFTSRSVYRSLSVMVDGHPVGHIGEEIAIEPGTRTVTVKTGWFTCRPQQVELRPGTMTNLEYQASWLAWTAIVFGYVVFMIMSLPIVFLLNSIKRLINDGLLELALVLVVLALWGFLAFIAPLRLLAALGIHSHTIEVAHSST